MNIEKIILDELEKEFRCSEIKVSVDETMGKTISMESLAKSIAGKIKVLDRAKDKEIEELEELRKSNIHLITLLLKENDRLEKAIEEYLDKNIVTDKLLEDLENRVKKLNNV